jgi:hypothetical protein
MKVWARQHLTADLSEFQPVAKTVLRRTSELIARDTRPNPNRGSKKLLDRFHDKIRSLRYALAT